MRRRAIGAMRETKRADTGFGPVSLEGSFSGYASVFGECDLGNDVILPGAFAKSLARRGAHSVRMLFQHDANQPIGVWNEIREDHKGLFVAGRIATDVERGREVLALMRAGAVDGLSIGFRTVRSRIDRQTGARCIIEADLWEISVVTFPMQPEAKVGDVKSGGPRGANTAHLPTVRQFEGWLVRDAGLSRSEARTVIAKGFAHLPGAREAAGVKTGDPVERMRLAVRSLTQALSERN